MTNINLQDANQPEVFDKDLSINNFLPLMRPIASIDIFDFDLYLLEESDISMMIMEDENLIQSIEAAKVQMRNGEAYLSYDDVFGE